MANQGNLVEELEASFQNCMALMTNQEHSLTADPDEMRNSMEQAMQRFIDAARQLDCFFMQRRLLLTSQKPELTAKEDVAELRAELERKNALLLRHSERLQNWSAMLNRSPSATGSSPPSAVGPASSAPGTATPTAVTLVPPGTPQSGTSTSQPSTPIIAGVVQPSLAQQQGAASFPGQGPLAFLEQTTSSIGRGGASLGNN